VYRTILFDIDGVILSEERYFDASALTVYELLHSPGYLGLPVDPVGLPPFTPGPDESKIRLIRRITFSDDDVLHCMKAKGINANWDMVYLQTAYQLTRILKVWVRYAPDEGITRLLTDVTHRGWAREDLKTIGQSVNRVKDVFVDYGAFCNEFEGCQSKSDLFEALEANVQSVFADIPSLPSIPRLDTHRLLWNVCRETFQEWYLGDTYLAHTNQPGKEGFLHNEVPLVPVDELGQLLKDCVERGIQIGIGTGRPELETTVPLKALGLLRFFEEGRVTTADDVLYAEREISSTVPLSKPHPYTYLRSYLGASDPQTILNLPLPLPDNLHGNVLVVGDSVADCLAAQAMGCGFAAVLTGLGGIHARKQFMTLGADYIWDNVLALRNLLD
jgi:phosphoglycolate phosphatase-like HAD superfamily hydrolase